VSAWHVWGEAARRLFGISDYHIYALAARCIREYLFDRQEGLQSFNHQWLEENNQLHLFDP